MSDKLGKFMELMLGTKCLQMQQMNFFNNVKELPSEYDRRIPSSDSFCFEDNIIWYRAELLWQKYHSNIIDIQRSQFKGNIIEIYQTFHKINFMICLSFNCQHICNRYIYFNFNQLKISLYANEKPIGLYFNALLASISKCLNQ